MQQCPVERSGLNTHLSQSVSRSGRRNWQRAQQQQPHAPSWHHTGLVNFGAHDDGSRQDWWSSCSTWWQVRAFQLKVSVDQDLTVVVEALDDDVVKQWLVSIVFSRERDTTA